MESMTCAGIFFLVRSCPCLVLVSSHSRVLSSYNKICSFVLLSVGSQSVLSNPSAYIIPNQNK